MRSALLSCARLQIRLQNFISKALSSSESAATAQRQWRRWHLGARQASALATCTVRSKEEKRGGRRKISNSPIEDRGNFTSHFQTQHSEGGGSHISNPCAAHRIKSLPWTQFHELLPCEIHRQSNRTLQCRDRERRRLEVDRERLPVPSVIE